MCVNLTRAAAAVTHECCQRPHCPPVAEAWHDTQTHRDLLSRVPDVLTLRHGWSYWTAPNYRHRSTGPESQWGAPDLQNRTKGPKWGVNRPQRHKHVLTETQKQPEYSKKLKPTGERCVHQLRGKTAKKTISFPKLSTSCHLYFLTPHRTGSSQSQFGLNLSCRFSNQTM